MKEKYTIYTAWVEGNYEQISRVLKSKNIFNADVFHDAIVAVYDELPNLDECSVTICDKIFKEKYSRLLSKANSATYQYAYFEDNGLFEIVVTQSTDDNAEFVKRYPADTSEKIKVCVQCDLSKEDSTLFMMSVNYPNLSIENIGKYFGIPKGSIFRKMNRIRNGIINSMNYRYGFENI